MAATTAMCTVFKANVMKAIHNFLLSGGNTIRAALIKSGMAGTYGAGSTSYTDVTGNSDEVTGTGYTVKGPSLTRVDPTTSGTTGFTDFGDATLSTATITARAAMIYDDTSASDSACSVHDFGADKTASGGDFTLVFPTPDASNAILRFA
jgi:hypothetical protein